MFSTPSLCLSQFHIEPGMIVADLGCGIGSYTFELVSRVGSSGKIIAVDVQKNLVDTLAQECKKRSINNVSVLWDDMDDNDGIAIESKSIDRVVIANILFQLDDIQKFSTEVKRILKPKGSALIVEWSDSFAGLGPPPQNIVSQSRAQEIFQKAGLSMSKTIQAGDHHYGFIVQSI